MIKKILLTLLAIIVMLVLIGLTLHQNYAVSRSVEIQAPAEKIFALISELKSWPEWEPFSESGKNMKTTLGEKTSGVGATQRWESDGNNGHLTFTECDPKTGIAYDVVFTNGERESPAKGWMHLNSRSDGQVEIVWSINGELNMPVIGGYFRMFVDYKLGPLLEHGLSKLKAKAEAR